MFILAHTNDSDFNDYKYGTENAVVIDENYRLEDAGVAERVAEAMIDALQDKAGNYFVASAARVFDRKGYNSFRPLGAVPSSIYMDENDDVVLQLTVRLEASEVEGLIDYAVEANEEMLAHKTDKKRAALLAEKALIEAKLAAL